MLKTTNESYISSRLDRARLKYIHSHTHTQHVDWSDGLRCIWCYLSFRFGSIQWIPILNDFRWLFIVWIYDCVYPQSSAYFMKVVMGWQPIICVYACDIDVSVIKRCTRYKRKQQKWWTITVAYNNEILIRIYKSIIHRWLIDWCYTSKENVLFLFFKRQKMYWYSVAFLGPVSLIRVYQWKESGQLEVDIKLKYTIHCGQSEIFQSFVFVFELSRVKILSLSLSASSWRKN